MAPLFGLITADFFLLTSDGQNLEEFTKLLTSIFKDLFTFTMFMGEMYGHLTTGAMESRRGCQTSWSWELKYTLCRCWE